MEPWMSQTFILILIGLVGYLLRKKDDEQGNSIALLHNKYEDLSGHLNRFELRIAQEHYVKPELDARFDKLENTFKQGFEGLGTKFDRLSDALTHHVIREENKK